MLVMRTTKDPAYPIRELISSQQPLGLNHFPLAINPFGLYGVEPRTLLGQKAAYDPHSTATVFDSAVILAEPASDLLGAVGSQEDDRGKGVYRPSLSPCNVHTYIL